MPYNIFVGIDISKESFSVSAMNIKQKIFLNYPFYEQRGF